jgi:putative FmdB family regulatory protein
MPLYEYECAKCGTHFDEIQKFSDRPLTKHPGCGGKVKRLLSAPAIQFKGSGWYITDYARKTDKTSSEGKSSDGKTDSDGKKESVEKKAESKSTETKASDNGSAKSESKPAGKTKNK